MNFQNQLIRNSYAITPPDLKGKESESIFNKKQIGRDKFTSFGDLSASFYRLRKALIMEENFDMRAIDSFTVVFNHNAFFALATSLILVHRCIFARQFN